jgi:hypothetical protein
MVGVDAYSFHDAVAYCGCLLVPRPAICEEMGLKLLLEQNGVGVEISREKYEGGDWANLVEEAWAKGQTVKENRRDLGAAGVDQRMKEIGQFASTLSDWLRDQQQFYVTPDQVPSQSRPLEDNIPGPPLVVCT